jgi:hypothetical protein
MNEHGIPRGAATCRNVLDAPPNMAAGPVGGALSLHPRPGPRCLRAGRLPGFGIERPVERGHAGAGAVRRAPESAPGEVLPVRFLALDALGAD